MPSGKIPVPFDGFKNQQRGKTKQEVLSFDFREYFPQMVFEVLRGLYEILVGQEFPAFLQRRIGGAEDLHLFFRR